MALAIIEPKRKCSCCETELVLVGYFWICPYCGWDGDNE